MWNLKTVALSCPASVGLLLACAPALAASASVSGHAIGATFRDCSNCPLMKVIPPGSSVMGSPQSERPQGGGTDEGPLHRVTIDYPLAVGQYLVTRGEFAAFAKATGYSGGDCQHWDGAHFHTLTNIRWNNLPFQTDRHPVVCVNVDDAHAYVRWLSSKTAKSYRLLSEAEWEYAARAGTSGPHYWSGGPADQCLYANATDLASKARHPELTDFAPCNDGYPQTSPVGHFRPNAFGLYDMLGDALVWVEDCYQNSYEGAPSDGRSRMQCAGPMSDQNIMRGGGWDSGPAWVRAAGRDVEHPWTRADTFGIRIARTDSYVTGRSRTRSSSSHVEIFTRIRSVVADRPDFQEL
jgi:formylglycine-generating enzyme required for sulfatase activity